MKRRYTLAAMGLVVVCLSAVAEAQVRETPVPFDSAGRLRTLTPSLVARLGLAAPAWPVEGAFREARLFASSGGLVLAVELTTGAVDRFALPDSGAALRAAIDHGLAQTGAIATEEQAFAVSEPARGHFLRRQLGLAWGLYGPLLAAMTNDETLASFVTLAAVPASFVIVHKLSRRVDVTRAQSDLAFDGAFRGGAVGGGALYVIAGDAPSAQLYEAVILGSAISTSVAAFKRAGRFTDGEAEASKAWSNYAALTTLGVLGTMNGLENGNARAIVAAILGTGVGGYLLGPRYARQPGYSATRGDVQLLSTGATLGVMTALTPIVGSDGDPQIGWGLATAGMLGGMYVAHRTWVRPYQHTTGDVVMTTLGTSAGALAGMAFLTLMGEPDANVSMGVVTAGAVVGTFAGHQAANPRRATASNRTSSVDERSRHQSSLEFTPANLALAAARVPGRHAALTFRF